MNIGGRDIELPASAREIVAAFAAAWPSMCYEDADGVGGIVAYRDGQLLDRDFFLYRDRAAAEHADRAEDDTCFEGVVFVIDRGGRSTWIVVDHSMPDDVRAVVDQFLGRK
jgi:hypothetical protein